MAKDNKRPLTSKSSLIIRLIAGMYLIYLAYELFMGLSETGGAPKALVIGAAAIFTIFGVTLAIVSGKAFLKGEFQGGVMDISVTEETIEGE